MTKCGLFRFSSTSPPAALASLLDHEEIEVAVLVHLASGGGSEDNDPLGLYGFDYRVDHPLDHHRVGRSVGVDVLPELVGGVVPGTDRALWLRPARVGAAGPTSPFYPDARIRGERRRRWERLAGSRASSSVRSPGAPRGHGAYRTRSEDQRTAANRLALVLRHSRGGMRHRDGPARQRSPVRRRVGTSGLPRLSLGSRAVWGPRSFSAFRDTRSSSVTSIRRESPTQRPSHEVPSASHSPRSTGIGRSPVLSGGTNAGRSTTPANRVRRETRGPGVEPSISPRSQSRRR